MKDENNYDLDLYEILEIHPRACSRVVIAAFGALSKIHHPDVGGDSNIYRRILDANKILSDAGERSRYDAQRRTLYDGAIGLSYKILEKIAEGGFGPTYKARHILSGELACIKHCHRISVQNNQILLDEAKTVWDLRHHALPAMRDVIKLEDGSLAIVMSYIPGPTLEQIVESNGSIEPEHVAWIAERVLNALMYLHYHGVIDGDVKPQNIIINLDTHTVTVIDFGISLVKPNGSSRAKGWTEGFAPPEEKAGRTLVPESDLYSLGMTMIYALSGNYDAMLRKDVPSSTPEPLCEFIRRLIVADVLSRPNWQKEDLTSTINQVREQSFGRGHSDMKPLLLKKK